MCHLVKISDDYFLEFANFGKFFLKKVNFYLPKLVTTFFNRTLRILKFCFKKENSIYKISDDFFSHSPEFSPNGPRPKRVFVTNTKVQLHT